MTQLVDEMISDFRYLTRRYALFNVVFFGLFIAELLTILLFLPFLAKSFLLAALVAATFLTTFTYFVLRFYFQTKKPEQFLNLRDEFVQACGSDPIPALHELIGKLEGQEHQYYPLPSAFEAVIPLVEKFSVWCHWADVQLMKELLHTYCIRSQLERVKEHPTNIELHAALARSYSGFYKIYQAPPQTYSFIAKEYASSDMVRKFQKNALCAIEELKIILHYRQHDAWALSQLGAIYQDLDQKDDEKKVYELLLQAAPHEKEAKFRLGVLYFKLGATANGLKIYEDFKRTNDPKAQELIDHYDLFHQSL